MCLWKCSCIFIVVVSCGVGKSNVVGRMGAVIVVRRNNCIRDFLGDCSAAVASIGLPRELPKCGVLELHCDQPHQRAARH